MPTYEYVCDTCHETFEAFQSIADEPLSACPHGHHTVRRLISGGAGLLFKGSGFYITDYRSKGYTEAARKESGGTKAESKSPPAAESTKKTKAA